MTDGLWNFEVVELFLVGANERYLEIECGPRGHHLVLRLEGVRNAVETGLALALTVEHRGGRWRGSASGPAAWLPEGLAHANAFAIHGQGAARRYLAAHPLPGDAPDFHQIGGFPAL